MEIKKLWRGLPSTVRWSLVTIAILVILVMAGSATYAYVALCCPKC